MLQTLREKTSGWIATVVLGLLIIPFAFVGVNEYMTGGNDNAVARVQAPPSWWQSAPSWWPVSMLWQHEEVAPQEFRDAFERERAQQREAMGDAFDPREFESADNKRKVLEQLIDQKALLLAARRSGVTIGNDAVRESIAAVPVFQGTDGKFDQARYAAVLASQSPPLSPQVFQEQERQRLQMVLLPMGIGESDFVAPKQLDRLLKLLGETRDITLAALPPVPADTAPISDDEISKWYESHRADYMQPEMVTVEYVDVDGAQLAAAAPEPDEATLRARYEREKSRYVSPEQRLVSHILVADQAKAAALAKQAREGADFATLAKANSEDTGSKDGGGDLGWIEKNGAMVKPFEDAVFALQAGAISEPVQSEFGWHVIQLREIKPGQGKSFEEVRADLARGEAEGARERAYTDLAGRLVTETLKNPTALGPAAATVGLQVQKVGPFARNAAPGIFANPAVLRVAFSEQLIEDGTVSDPIEITPTHSVVIRVAGHTPEQARPLAQVRESVIAAIRADRQGKAAEKAADAMLARLAKGESLKDIAMAEKLQHNQVPGLPRGVPVPSPEANEAIFAAQRPAAGKPSAGKVKLGADAYAVFTVDKVSEGDLSKVTPEQRDGLRRQLLQVQADGATRSFIESTRKQFKITVHEDRL